MEAADSTRFERSLQVQEEFEKALASERELLRGEADEQTRKLREEIEEQKALLKAFFDKRQGELEESQKAFREAQAEAISAAEQLQEAQTRLEAHRLQGTAHLEEIRNALKELLEAMRATCRKHLGIGLSIVALHMFVYWRAKER